MKKINFSKLNERLDALVQPMNFARIRVCSFIQQLFSSKDVPQLITSTLPRLLENLSLIFLTDGQTINHWKTEVVGNISRYNFEKGKHTLRVDKYYDLLWGETEYAKDPSKLKKLLQAKFKKEKLELPSDLDEVIGRIRSFMILLSVELGKGQISKEEIYEMLDEVKNS